MSIEETRRAQGLPRNPAGAVASRGAAPAPHKAQEYIEVVASFQLLVKEFQEITKMTNRDLSRTIAGYDNFMTFAPGEPEQWATSRSSR